MSIMIAEVYKALVEAGAPEDSARAAASSIPVAKDLAGKQEIAEVRQEIGALRAEVKQEIAEVRQEIGALRAEVKQEIAEVRQEIGALRAEVKQEIAEVRQEIGVLRAEVKSDLKLIKFVYGPAVLLMLAKLVFFP